MKKVLSVMLTLLWAVVTAQAQSNNVSIEWPAEAFQSPDGTLVVPLETSLTFKANGGSDWKWTFEGGTPDQAEGQEATVSYAAEGNYDLELLAGATTVSLDKGVRAGGNNYVWNIQPSERSALDVIALAWFGWYGGTNWLDMVKFAEYFHHTTQPATIDSVAVYFGSFDATTTDQKLTLTIAAVDDNGMPGAELGSTSLLVSEINKSATEATYFCFEQPVAVDGAFFVVVGGFPNAAADAIAMQCVRREYGQLCTAYHQLRDETAGAGDGLVWYKNVDDPTSFAISPHLCYGNTADTDGIGAVRSDEMSFDGERLQFTGDVQRLQVFSLDGTLLLDQPRPASAVSLASLTPGIYVVRVDNNKVMKVCVR